MFRELNMTLGLSKMSTDQLADEYYQVKQMKPTDCLNVILLSFNGRESRLFSLNLAFPPEGSIYKWKLCLFSFLKCLLFCLYRCPVLRCYLHLGWIYFQESVFFIFKRVFFIFKRVFFIFMRVFFSSWGCILRFQERLSDQYSISLPEYGVLEVPQHHPHHYNQ